MKRMDVRCCCRPDKLLGSVPVPDSTQVGTEVTFHLVRAMSVVEAFRGATEFVSPERIHLVATEWSSFGQRGVALKAEGVPVETLQRIPGFIKKEHGSPTDD